MVKYRIDVNDDGIERVCACANLYLHKRYLVAVVRESRGVYSALFEIRDYNKPTLDSDLTGKSGSYIRFRLVCELTKMSEEQIRKIVKLFPRPLLDKAFELAIPEVYIFRKRVKSQKYKLLLSDYDYYENRYFSIFGNSARFDEVWGNVEILSEEEMKEG